MRNAMRITAFLAVGLVAGFGIAKWNAPGAADRERPAATANPLADRVAALEQALRLESGRRAVLAAEVDELRVVLEDAGGMDAVLPTSPALHSGDRSAAGADESRGSASAPRQRTAEPSRDRLAGGVDMDQWRAERLVNAGFSPDRADWINRRNAELRMQALEQEYRAARGGEEFDARTVLSGEDALRAELGDSDYERYLEAIGRPTSIGVRNVLASSPAEQAGLLPGDEVIAYGGERVFDVEDLNRLTLDGEPGETVALDVMREGQPIQLYVPRGPIGIMGGGRFGRRP
jgi:hypothetical protein